MNILHAKTQVFLDGQEVFARGITSTDKFLTMEGAEVPPILGAQTVRVVYPDGFVWERVCDARMEFDDAGRLECRYYPTQTYSKDSDSYSKKTNGLADT